MAASLDKTSAGFHMGLVRDGVMCGDSKICLNQTCKDISGVLSYTRCPQNVPPQGGQMQECSTNGVRMQIVSSYIFIDKTIFL